MKIDVDEIRARVKARMLTYQARAEALRQANVAELQPRRSPPRPRGVTIARILPWRRRDDDAPR